MKKILKKTMSFLISFSLIFSAILPFNGVTYADVNEKTNTIKEVTDTYVNPMYEGIDLNIYAANKVRRLDNRLNKNQVTFDNLEQASDYMKKQMVQRSNVISFTVNTPYYKNINNDIFEKAISYNDEFNPNEGDYLKANYSGYNVNMSYTSSSITFNFSVSYLSTHDEELKVDSEVKKVLDELNVYNEDEYTKIKAVHDYIAKNINYDHSLKNHSSYNAIVEKNVVCQGYASITYRLLKELDVGVRYITGNGNGGLHAWNIVKIDSKWYNIDNTWDENISLDDEISYKYFLNTMNDFEKHTRDDKYSTNSFNQTYPMAETLYVHNNNNNEKDTEIKDEKDTEIKDEKEPEIKNETPVINTDNITIEFGKRFNPLARVKVLDKEDGDITYKVEVIKNNVNSNIAGDYSVTYKVVDSNGASTIKTIKVVVPPDTTQSSPVLKKTVALERIKGNNRYETAAKIADKQNYKTAILVNSDKSLADGLSASGLSGAVDAPILLTKMNNIPNITQDKLKNVEKVYLIGSENAMSKSIENSLVSKGINVKRLGGKDRYATSYLIAEEINSIKHIDKVLLVNGIKGEADAISASAVASRDASPIILTNGKNIDFSTNNILTYVIGSKNAMSDTIVSKTNAIRLGGVDRFETNKILINHFYDNLDEFYLSKSDVLVDALTASSIAKDKPVILVNSSSDKSILSGAKKLNALGGIDEYTLMKCMDVAKNI